MCARLEHSSQNPLDVFTANQGFKFAVSESIFNTWMWTFYGGLWNACLVTDHFWHFLSSGWVLFVICCSKRLIDGAAGSNMWNEFMWGGCLSSTGLAEQFVVGSRITSLYNSSDINVISHVSMEWICLETVYTSIIRGWFDGSHVCQSLIIMVHTVSEIELYSILA